MTTVTFLRGPADGTLLTLDGDIPAEMRIAVHPVQPPGLVDPESPVRIPSVLYRVDPTDPRRFLYDPAGDNL